MRHGPGLCQGIDPLWTVAAQHPVHRGRGFHHHHEGPEFLPGLHPQGSGPHSVAGAPCASVRLQGHLLDCRQRAIRVPRGGRKERIQCPAATTPIGKLRRARDGSNHRCFHDNDEAGSNLQQPGKESLGSKQRTNVRTKRFVGRRFLDQAGTHAGATTAGFGSIFPPCRQGHHDGGGRHPGGRSGSRWNHGLEPRRTAVRRLSLGVRCIAGGRGCHSR
mmetsp:Transcript_24485/g.54611  ORF Transcript_24485/g.54611 Transcript_24485/m.54611 type:complete len:218 (+) Transcript_24485:400-1053(+)